MSNPVIVVVGAGPGMGASVARRFGREGFDVALVGMPADQHEALGEPQQGEGIPTRWAPADLTAMPSTSSFDSSTSSTPGSIARSVAGRSRAARASP